MYIVKIKKLQYYNDMYVEMEKLEMEQFWNSKQVIGDQRGDNLEQSVYYNNRWTLTNILLKSMYFILYT